MNEVVAREIATERMVLRPLSLGQAQAIVQGDRTGQAWCGDYPTDGDRVIASLTIMASVPSASPWTSYQLVDAATSLVVGGAGFKSAPVDGVVEIGYGLAASARGRGLATEAVEGLVVFAAATTQVTAVEAHTEPGNVSSQQVLLRAGFERTATAGDLLVFQRKLS